MENNKSVKEEVVNNVSDLSDEQLNKVLESRRWTIMQVLDLIFLTE